MNISFFEEYERLRNSFDHSNCSIAGETLDYGPCAFLDEFHHDKVFSSIDHAGRYAYSNQPLIAQWNLARLAECLLMLEDAHDAYSAVLKEFTPVYESFYLDRMRAKLGLSTTREGDDGLIRDFLDRLQADHLDYTLSFRRLADRVDAGDDAEFGDFEVRWRERLASEGRDPAEVSEAMNRLNPLFIARNHQVERAIERAIDDDLSVFHELNEVLRSPFDQHPEFEQYASPPEAGERVMQTFCGT